MTAKPFELSPVASVEPASLAATAAQRSPAHVLQGNEIIELSIKPSPWYVVFVSARIVTALLLIAAAVAVWSANTWTLGAGTLFTLCVGGAVARFGLAVLQWASRLYVLTNRRVLVFRGVLRVEVEELPLNRVAEVTLQATLPQRWLRLGSIWLQPTAGQTRAALAWKYVDRPQEIQDRLWDAVRRSQHPPGGASS